MQETNIHLITRKLTPYGCKEITYMKSNDRPKTFHNVTRGKKG